MKILRWYQKKGNEEIAKGVLAGKVRPMVWLPTGAGKTQMFCSFIKDKVDGGCRVAVVVRSKNIVWQNYQRVREHIPETGMVMGSRKVMNNKKVQVCSIDTLINRPKSFLDNFDIVIVDECHNCTSHGYSSLLNRLDGKLVIGFTATPFFVGNKGHVFWDSVIVPATAKQLTEEGFLCPLKFFVPKKKIDTTGIRTSGGDYNQRELSDRASKSEVIRDVVEEYLDKSFDKVGLCFAVSKSHAKLLNEKFKQSGVDAAYVDDETPIEDRLAVIKKLEAAHAEGRGFIICNVNIFSTGVDIPVIEVIVCARPTKSKNMFFQQIGRGTRIEEGKEGCDILDCAGNVLVHGTITDDHDPELKNKLNFVRKVSSISERVVCQNCGYFTLRAQLECEGCGGFHTLMKKKRGVNNVDDFLVEMETVSGKVKKKVRMTPVEAKSKFLKYSKMPRSGKVRLEVAMALLAKREYLLLSVNLKSIPEIPDWVYYRARKKHIEILKKNILNYLRRKNGDTAQGA